MWPRNTRGYHVYRSIVFGVVWAALIAWGIVEGVSWLLGKL